MRYALQWIRSALFVVQMYVMLAVIALAFAPWALVEKRGARAAARFYCYWVRWTAAWMVGLRSEIRGTVPTGAVLVASKHQSFFDIILIMSALDRPRFIMKKELKWMPFFGWYALRVGCVPVDRAKRGAAIAKMVEDVTKTADDRGQLIIYPQGTRVAAGVKQDYKVGAGILYAQLGQPCVPAATNVGVFWPRHGVYRKPGLAVMEFLPPIPPGLPLKVFMKDIAPAIEDASDRLMREAGFALPDTDTNP